LFIIYIPETLCWCNNWIDGWISR